MSWTKIKSMLPFSMTDAWEIHIEQMPGHSHTFLIIFQHFRLSDFDCHLFQTKDFKARHKCLLNCIWLISLNSIFVTSKDSTCCSPRQTYSGLIWKWNEAWWITTSRVKCDRNSVILNDGISTLSSKQKHKLKFYFFCLLVFKLWVHYIRWYHQCIDLINE